MNILTFAKSVRSNKESFSRTNCGNTSHNPFHFSHSLFKDDFAQNRKYSSNRKIEWTVMKEIYEKSKFSFPEIEALYVQFNRRVGDDGKIQKSEFSRFLAPLLVLRAHQSW